MSEPLVLGIETSCDETAAALVTDARSGSMVQGGSTITQQLAKTSFLSSDRSYKRKAQEVIIAFWLEAWLTKDEILSRYLSSVYFGDGVYGLRAAAHHYFGREPQNLSLAQSAMLAGMVQAPSRLAPTRNLAGAQKRSRLVLQEMADTGAISLTRARSTPSARPIVQPQKIPAGTYFADWVAPAALAAFDSDYGEVKVPTTLDADLQKLAVRAVASAGIPNAQAALVAMRPDGRVVAMVGGNSYAQSPFNRATQARRQPGSAFKLFVYLAAMRAGYSPDDMIEDRPITIDGWTPRNSDGVYRGSITLRDLEEAVGPLAGEEGHVRIDLELVEIADRGNREGIGVEVVDLVAHRSKTTAPAAWSRHAPVRSASAPHAATSCHARAGRRGGAGSRARPRSPRRRSAAYARKRARFSASWSAPKAAARSGRGKAPARFW